QPPPHSPLFPYTTLFRSGQATKDAGTEQAWSGSNGYLKRIGAFKTVRLYKSTFENPKPGQPIVSLDYISNDTAAAPFLVGLTVEDRKSTRLNSSHVAISY